MDSDDEETEVSELDKINNLLNDLTIIKKEIDSRHRLDVLLHLDNYMNTVGEFNKIMGNYKGLMEQEGIDFESWVWYYQPTDAQELIPAQAYFNIHIQTIIDNLDHIKVQKEEENIKIQNEEDIEGGKISQSMTLTLPSGDEGIIISNGL